MTYVVTDEYGSALSIPSRRLFGAANAWLDSLAVEARRQGNDRDGRLYTVTATIKDAAGNTASASTKIVVEHDQGNR